MGLACSTVSSSAIRSATRWRYHASSAAFASSVAGRRSSISGQACPSRQTGNGTSPPSATLVSVFMAAPPSWRGCRQRLCCLHRVSGHVALPMSSLLSSAAHSGFVLSPVPSFLEVAEAHRRRPLIAGRLCHYHVRYRSSADLAPMADGESVPGRDSCTAAKAISIRLPRRHGRGVMGEL